MREGASDTFYMIWSSWLADGDTVTVSDFTGPASITIANKLINGTPLVLDGVTYAAGLVTHCDVSGIDLGDKVELVNTVTTSNGRIEKRSLWIRGVKNYS